MDPWDPDGGSNSIHACVNAARNVKVIYRPAQNGLPAFGNPTANCPRRGFRRPVEIDPWDGGGGGPTAWVGGSSSIHACVNLART